MSKRPKYVTKHERLRELRAFIVLCFELIGETDFKEIANMTGLCVATIMRLANEQATLYCRYNTIDALGRAAGYQLRWTKAGKARIKSV